MASPAGVGSRAGIRAHGAFLTDRKEWVMPRISYVEPQNAPTEVKVLYEQVFKGKPGNVQKLLAHRPEILKNFLNFYASVGKGLDQRLYEMVYIRVSLLNHCHY